MDGVRASLLLAALNAFFLPCCGAVLDHHFGERLPDHEHLYLQSFVPDHLHPYEMPHPHSHAYVAGDARLREASNSDPAPDGVVCLTSQDRVNQGFAQLTVPSLHLSSAFPSPDETRHTFAIPKDGLYLRDVYLALPEKPPRA